MGLLIAIGLLILFDVLALRFGVDSRDREALGGYWRPFERERTSGKVARVEPESPTVSAKPDSRRAVAQPHQI